VLEIESKSDEWGTSVTGVPKTKKEGAREVWGEPLDKNYEIPHSSRNYKKRLEQVELQGKTVWGTWPKNESNALMKSNRRE